MSDENLTNGQNSVSPPHKNLKDSLATLGQVKNVTDRIIKTANVDREQITTNKEDISSLKEELSKNYLDDAKTKRSLDALWKLNQGISYQFETDTERAYQKDIPSGAKLVSVKKIGGRTIVWNQIASINLQNPFTMNGVTFINNGDGSVTVNGTASDDAYIIVVPRAKINGKVVIGSRVNTENYGVAFGLILSNGYIMIERPNNITVCVKSGVTVDNIKIYPQVFDLTKMFGAGNEPSTPEEFEALFPEDYYPYNEGTLMSIPVNEVVEKGRNLFDEKMELGLMNYDVNSENFGENIASQNQLRASNYIPVEPNTQYFLNSNRAIAFIYDAKRKPIKIGSNGFLSMGRLFTTPSNARYLKFYLTKEYGIIYNSDLILTKGATTAYSPYHKNAYLIPQAILNLDGFGDGVSDDVYNYVDWENKEYHKRVGKVDLGSLTYTNNGTASDGSTQWKTKEKISKKDGSYVCVCPAFTERRASGTIVPITNGICDLRDDCSISLGYIGVTNAEDFAQAMFGVMLYYELAEEQIIDISDIIDSTFQEPIEVEAGGTLTFQNSNGDGYRLPVPNEEEYIVSLAEVGGGASE